MEPSDENEYKMTKKKVEYDGEEDGETREQQQQKCGKSVPNTDTNDTIGYNNSTSASRKHNNDNNNNNNNNDKMDGKEVINMETNTMIINNELNGEALEAKVKSENSNSSNG